MREGEGERYSEALRDQEKREGRQTDGQTVRER